MSNDKIVERDGLHVVVKHGLLHKVFVIKRNYSYPTHEDHQFDWVLDSTWESEEKANEHAKILNNE